MGSVGIPQCFLFAGVLILGVVASQAQTDSPSSGSAPGHSIPGTGGPSAFASSVPSKLVPGVIQLSLQDAVDRALKQNLGLLLTRADTRSARGQRWDQLSTLLPHVTAAPFWADSKINIDQGGLSGVANLFHISPSVGPYSFFDARVAVSQTLFDWQAISATRAAGQIVKSADYTFQDAHDLVVLAVGYTYLQAIAAEARIETDVAQIDTAQALYDQAADQVKAGTAADIDALRVKLELQTRQQQLIQAKNDFAIQKLTVARVIGLAPGQEFEFADKSPYQPFEGITVDEAVKRAYESRSDYRAAIADVRAAQLSHNAAAAGYFPSLSFGANYGEGGINPGSATQVHDVRATLSIPLFTGGSVHGEVLKADAKLDQSQERLDSLRGQIDAEVRTALLNLQSSAERVNVARSSVDLADLTLVQSKDRFSAGVTDSVEVVQSQQAVASAHEQYISSLYSYNLAKISLARALGIAEQGVKEYFRGQ